MIKENDNVETNEEIASPDVVTSTEEKKVSKPIENSNEPYVIGYVNADKVYVRKEPRDHGGVLYILKKNKAVIINPKSSTDEYYLISVESVVGYVKKDLITLK